MKLASALLAVAVASGVGVSFAGLTIDDDIIVKTGADTNEIAAAQIGSRSVRVEGGVLRVLQTATTRARYIRFTVREKNPWRDTNRGELTQMDSFELVKGEALVAYPAGTTARNSDGTEGTAPKILTYDRDQTMNWCENEKNINGFTIDMGEAVEFDGYVIGPATISTGRMPYSFTVEVGVDNGNGGIDWALFDDKTQFCSAGYGADWFTKVNNYSPRMPPVYAVNPFPVFSTNATVEVAAGAALDLVGVSGRVPNLTGSGCVNLTDARPQLTGDCTFTGSFDGYGSLTFAMDNDVVSAFSFASLAIRVANAGKSRAWLVAGGVTPAKLPIVSDTASAPLNLEISGTVETPKLPRRVDRYGNDVPFVRYGQTVLKGAATSVTPLATVPSVVKHFRYIPITGYGAYVEQVDEIKFLKGNVLQDATDLQIAYMDAFRTTNYTSGVLSDQNAMGLSGNQPTATNLFDSSQATYHQYNQQSNARGCLESTPGLTMTFRQAKCFDSFEFWQPHYGVASGADNTSYWPGMWRLETSVDGNVWEVLDDQSAEKVAASKLYTGWPPVVTTPVASGAVPRTEVWLSASDYLLTEDFTFAAVLKYVRLFITELVTTDGTSQQKSYMDVGELELHQGGQKVAWPTGAIAYRTDGQKTAVPGLINAPSAMPYDDWQHATDNEALDRGEDTSRSQEEWRAIWDPGYAVMSQGAGFVVEMSQVPTFEEYKIYAGYNWAGNYRTLGQWTVDVSYDGADWRTVDRFNCHDAGVTLPNIWMTDQFYMKRSVDFSSVGRAKTTRFDDGAVVRVVEGATLTMGNADETVGGLAGAGSVVLADASLTVADGESIFSGAFSSSANGSLIVDGGTMTFSKANLRHLEKIVLKNGAVLKGTAYFNSGLKIEVGAGCENQLRKAAGLTLIFR